MSGHVTLLTLLLLVPGCTLSFDLGPTSDPVLPPGVVPDRDPSSEQPDHVDQQARVGEPLAFEACNGVDDDGDGRVDEGYPDGDANGVTDCLEVVCEDLDPGRPGSVASVEACGEGARGVSAEPWELRVLWEWDSGDLAVTQAGQVAVAELDDDNGDGRVNEEDEPDLVFDTLGAVPGVGGSMLALRGRSGAVAWAKDGGGHAFPPLVADVNGDGSNDILTFDEAFRPVLRSADGTPRWTGGNDTANRRRRPPAVADVDADGSPELVVGHLLLDGRTGAIEADIGSDLVDPAAVAEVVDADLDGRAEVYWAGAAWDTSGALRWVGHETGEGPAWPLVLQADDDAEAEIAWLRDTLRVYDADGTAVAQHTMRTGEPGPPCAGDLDGDGEIEVAWVDGGRVLAFDLDGSLAWEVTLGPGDMPGCSVFDFDGDNAAEVVVADDESVQILDGRSGTRRVREPSALRAAALSYPVVADVDGDGDADLVLSGADAEGRARVIVYTNASGSWAESGSDWPVWNFAVGNVDVGGHVPGHGRSWWDEAGTYRGRPAGDSVDLPDLTVTVTDVCVTSCSHGVVEVAVQVTNQGPRDQYAGEQLVLYARDVTGLREMGRAVLPTVPAATRIAPVLFRVDPASVGALGWVASVEDDGSDEALLPDCDATNDSSSWTAPVCTQ